MPRREGAWLADIAEAITAIERYLEAGTLAEGVVYDACRARLIEIGEAVKHLDPVLLESVPDIRWRAIARMRDQLAHHYFDTDHAIVTQAVNEELPRLRDAVTVLLRRINEPPPNRPS